MGLPTRPRLLCCLFLTLSLAAAATRHHEWHSDCVRKLAVTINGHTLGPTIRAIQGDNVVDQVNNSLLTKNVAIHWHGIRQIIGTEGVTQCPILPGDVFTYTFTVDHPGTYMYHAHYEMQRSAGLNGIIVVEAAAARGAPDAEPFAYDGEHDKLLNDRWHKSTYEQASGLASVPIGWGGEPQFLLINNGRGRFNSPAVATAGTCDATIPECDAPVFDAVPAKTYQFRITNNLTSSCALNFEIEVHEDAVNIESTANQKHKARLIAYAKEPITVQPVASYTTRNNRPPMAFVAVMVFSSSAWSGSFPHWDRIVPPTVGVRDNEGPLLSFVTALWAYDSAVVVGIFHGFETIVGGWSTAPKVVYGVSAVLVMVLLAVGFMAAWCHISSMAGNIDMLWASASCVKLGAILSSDLVVVALSCKLGRAGSVAALPSAAAMTLIMAAMWIWGNHHAVANAVASICRGRIAGLRRQSQPAAAGDDMA